jgi:hypothetical protein
MGEKMFKRKRRTTTGNGHFHPGESNTRHKMEAIWRIGATINSETDLDKILRLVCRAAVDLFPVDHSGLVLFAPNQTTGVVKAEYPELGTIGTTIPLEGWLPAHPWARYLIFSRTLIFNLS